jgi:molybdopterin/thiamine biosynthesis adenylyltransferase/nitroreductase
MAFDYHAAFARNLGWVTETEQEVLRNKRIAIAGMGGVGGSHLLTLTRLGVGAFKLADFDQFELPNFNRQAGASLRHLERNKIEVMSELALDINPELDLGLFPDGVNLDNLEAFLEGVDLYVDSLDFFALEIRSAVFAACHEKGIPAITAAPLGMGSALLCFLPGQMSFEQYFLLQGQPPEEQALRFMLGLAPTPQHMSYLVDDSRIKLDAKEGPSTPMACELCAGFAGSFALKILLGRGDVPAAPRGIHFDAYRNKLATTWRPWGNANPLQRLGLMIARKRVMSRSGGAAVEKNTPEPEKAMERILDLARWAPSGDNDQPWQFDIVDDNHVVIHATDTREWCVYDLDGTSSQIAVRALLETIAIAASAEGIRAEFSRRRDTPETALMIDVQLHADAEVVSSPLLPFIRARSTQRRPLTTRSLLPRQKRAMEVAVGEGYRVHWLEGRSNRWQMARLLFHSAHIRLTTPEAYEVHRKNVEWGVQFSEDRIPEYAVGVDRLTGKVMRWGLESWDRVKMLNRFFAGTWLPRLQMDLLTGLRCAAHFVILADRPLETADDYIAGGRAMQRFWLEATRQGLQFQPEMTPLIFSRYVATSQVFTERIDEREVAVKVATDLGRVLADNDALTRVYMGRLGFGPAPESRSLRLPLGKLMVQPADSKPFDAA